MAGTGVDAFMWAAVFEKYDNIRAWLQYFDGGSAFLNRTEPSVGATTILTAAIQAPNGGEEVAQTLLDAKANLYHLTDNGCSVLHEAASNQNNTAGLLALLVRAGADVNLQQTSRTRKWRWIQRFARWAVEHGAKGGLLQLLAYNDGCTPLMDATFNGKVAEVQQLLDLAADATIKNDQGRTALDVARSEFGGHAPYLIQQLLDPA